MKLLNFLNTINNCLRLKKPFVLFPYNRYYIHLLSILKKNDVITAFNLIAVKELIFKEDSLLKKNYKQSHLIKVFFANLDKRKIEVKIVSKKTKKIFIKVSKIKRLCYENINTIYILSTNKGLLTAPEAYKKNCGGEILFKINFIYE